MGRGEAYIAGQDNSTDCIATFLTREVRTLSKEAQTNTPRRFVEAFRELMGKNDEDWKFTTFQSDCDEMVLVREIKFVSMCEHHLLPFLGQAHVGYIPQGQIAGLSKIARAVRWKARGIWAQENLTMAIASFLEQSLEPRGVAVVLEAEHTCMAIRGVKADGTKTTTSAMRGAFREEGNYARAEFLGLLR
jgi:GTP cyclohydrolase I